MTISGAQGTGILYPKLPPLPQQLPKTQQDWDRFINVMQQWQQSVQIAPVVQKFPTGNGVTAVIPGTLYQPDSTLLGQKFVWVYAANPAYYCFATLPASNSATADSLNIRATINIGWSAGSSNFTDILMGNRNGFSAIWNRFGPAHLSAPVGISAYAQTDGSVNVYAYGAANTYGYLYLSILNAGDFGGQVALIPNPSPVTVPSGTLVFDTSNETTYPPLVHSP